MRFHPDALRVGDRAIGERGTRTAKSLKDPLPEPRTSGIKLTKQGKRK